MTIEEFIDFTKGRYTDDVIEYKGETGVLYWAIMIFAGNTMMVMMAKHIVSTPIRNSLKVLAFGENGSKKSYQT